MFVAVRFLDSSKSISLSNRFVNTFLKLFLKIFSSIFLSPESLSFSSWGFLSSFAYRILPFSFVFVNTFWQTFLVILHYHISFSTLFRAFSCLLRFFALYVVVGVLFVWFFLYVGGEQLFAVVVICVYDPSVTAKPCHLPFHGRKVSLPWKGSCQNL